MLKAWLTALTEPEETLALGIRFPDRSVVLKRVSQGFPAGALEQSLRGIAETFQVLTLHRSTAQRLTLIFDRVQVYAVQRTDKTCLGLYLSADDKSFGDARFSALAREFSNVQ